jgi:hypothetical protein
LKQQGKYVNVHDCHAQVTTLPYEFRDKLIHAFALVGMPCMVSFLQQDVRTVRLPYFQKLFVKFGVLDLAPVEELFQLFRFVLLLQVTTPLTTRVMYVEVVV